ncbi:hypothetical protein GGX14DRAFT_383691, partial [Mycena pura]
YKRLEGGVEFIDVIPKTPSGKLLRRVLRPTESLRNPEAHDTYTVQCCSSICINLHHNFLWILYFVRNFAVLTKINYKPLRAPPSKRKIEPKT